jgi:N-methylhydantoinase A
MQIILGVDTGGTFTDFVLFQAGVLNTCKVLSTPGAPEEAILQGINILGLDANEYEYEYYIVHGSTVATNAVLEGKGVECAYITNQGLTDVLTIGRQTRRQLYHLQPKPVTPPIASAYCLETSARLAFDGTERTPITNAELEDLLKRVKALKVKAVAINLLFSYLDDRQEKQIACCMPDNIFVSRSSSVLPVYREYERGMTTWLNAYVGPLVEGYLQRLQDTAGRAKVAVMQSSGGTIDAKQAGHDAVRMLLSGPAGGLAAARYVGTMCGREHILSFDMGGTSTDVAMMNGEIKLTSEGEIAGYPVGVPMVDMHTIGAGGGSIATLDEGGVLQVGPESAGANPGPACYAQGGRHVTVTDANLILGRLRTESLLGGSMQLERSASLNVIKPLSIKMNMTIEAVAEGVIRIANEHMSQALRIISVDRGIDPKNLTLMSFGGAGGLHVCALAEAMHMRKALVPMHAGVFSALGMLVAPRSRQLSRSHIGLIKSFAEDSFEAAFNELEQKGLSSLQKEGVQVCDIKINYSLDLRYSGQSYVLNIPWTDQQTVQQEFHVQHQLRFGHRLELPVELVNVRVALSSEQKAIKFHKLSVGIDVAAQTHVTLYGIEQEVAVYIRDQLNVGQIINGPALITETVSTTFIATGWFCCVDDMGNLLLELTG